MDLNYIQGTNIKVVHLADRPISSMMLLFQHLLVHLLSPITEYVWFWFTLT